MFQNSSQSSIGTFFSLERPIAFRKSLGVLILSSMIDLVKLVRVQRVTYHSGVVYVIVSVA